MNPVTRRFRLTRWLVAATVGSAFLFNDCDPTLRTTTENGIISVSTAAWGSFLQALVQVVQDDLANSNDNGS